MPSGKLYKRDDVWYIDISTGRKVDGQYERIRRRAHGVTKHEAQADLDETLYQVLKEMQSPRKSATNKFLLQQVVDDWCAHIKRTKPDAKLANGYCVSAQRMADYLKVKNVSDITAEAVEVALSEISTALSTNSANKSLAKLKAALDYAVERGVIATNPITKTKQMKTVRKKFRRELASDEIEALLELSPEPWRTFWHFFLSTGVRNAEFRAVRPDDINFQAKHVRILTREDFSPKTQAGARTIPLGNNILAALKKLPSSGDGKLFFAIDGVAIRPEKLLDTFREHASIAIRATARKRVKEGLALPYGATYDKRMDEFTVDTGPVDLHSLRYTFITEMIGAGVDVKTVQYLAGHKSIQTTLAIYAQVKGGNTAEAIQNLPWERVPNGL